MKALKDLWGIFVEVMGFGVKQTNDFYDCVKKNREACQKLMVKRECDLQPSLSVEVSSSISEDNIVFHEFHGPIEIPPLSETPIYDIDKDEIHYKGKVYRP